MAKMIKSRKRRRGGARKAAKRAARRVIVKTKNVYRRAKGINVSTKDVVISVAAGGAGAIGSAVVLQKLPIANESAKNAVVTAIGGFLTYKGVKKKNMAVTGLGMGMAAVGAASIIKTVVPGVASLGAPFIRYQPALGAPIMKRVSAVSAPFKRVETVNGCDTSDYV